MFFKINVFFFVHGTNPSPNLKANFRIFPSKLTKNLFGTTFQLFFEQDILRCYCRCCYFCFFSIKGAWQIHCKIIVVWNASFRFRLLTSWRILVHVFHMSWKQEKLPTVQLINDVNQDYISWQFSTTFATTIAQRTRTMVTPKKGIWYVPQTTVMTDCEKRQTHQ